MSTPHSTMQPGQTEPTWEIAELFPAQGQWSPEEYLALETNRLVEYTHGHVQVLPMPTQKHQLIVLLLYRLLHQHVHPRNLGTALVAALRVLLWEGKFREPDVVFMLTENDHRRQDLYWDGADLVMEVVSPGAENRERDTVTKRREYARAGISEYWLVEPEEETVTVLSLADRSYREHGVFRRGERAGSVLLPGFEVAVDDVFDVA